MRRASDHGGWLYQSGAKGPDIFGMTAWFRVHLMNDTANRKLFYGTGCTLCTDSRVQVMRNSLLTQERGGRRFLYANGLRPTVVGAALARGGSSWPRPSEPECEEAMKRSFKLYPHVTTSVPNRGKLAVTGLFGAMLVAGLGCTGVIHGDSGPTGSGNRGGPSGTGAGSGSGGTGTGSGGTGTGSGGTGTGSGTGGQGGDPYAIPTSPPASVLVPTSRLARLSRQQWSNAVRDLLKLTDISAIDSNVSGDALIGFDDEADALYVTEQLRSQLFDASEQLANKVTGDATALARLVPANAPTDTAGRGKAFITAFGQRAFRRPLTTAEVTTHVGLFNQGTTLYPGVDAFKAGASLVIQAMLQSPYFLYRTELGTAATGAGQVALNDWEVGAKLALSITNTIPDDTLLAAAAAGQLHDKTAVVDPGQATAGRNDGHGGPQQLQPPGVPARACTTGSSATRRCSPTSRRTALRR